MEVIESFMCDVPLLRVSGEVDHFTAGEFDGAVQRAIKQDGCRLLLDLTECPYLDSGGLAVILSLVRQVQANGWMGVIGSGPNLVRLFEIVGLTSQPEFHMFASREEASVAVCGGST